MKCCSSISKTWLWLFDSGQGRRRGRGGRKFVVAIVDGLDEKTTEGEVNASVAQGKSLGVDATPTIFLNGRPLVGNVPWEQLKTIIDEELHYQQTAHNAGEKCCEVKIPSALNN